MIGEYDRKRQMKGNSQIVGISAWVNDDAVYWGKLVLEGELKKFFVHLAMYSMIGLLLTEVEMFYKRSDVESVWWELHYNRWSSV